MFCNSEKKAVIFLRKKVSCHCLGKGALQRKKEKKGRCQKKRGGREEFPFISALLLLLPANFAHAAIGIKGDLQFSHWQVVPKRRRRLVPVLLPLNLSTGSHFLASPEKQIIVAAFAQMPPSHLVSGRTPWVRTPRDTLARPYSRIPPTELNSPLWLCGQAQAQNIEAACPFPFPSSPSQINVSPWDFLLFLLWVVSRLFWNTGTGHF